MLDQSGNLYGTTGWGGLYNGGAVFEMRPQDGNWAFSLIYSFPNPSGPGGGVIMDGAGNLYGTTSQGPEAPGTVFELTFSDSSWWESILHTFNGSDGAFPAGGLVFDANGNLFGTTPDGGSGLSICNLGCGVAFEVTP